MQLPQALRAEARDRVLDGEAAAQREHVLGRVRPRDPLPARVVRPPCSPARWRGRRCRSSQPSSMSPRVSELVVTLDVRGYKIRRQTHSSSSLSRFWIQVRPFSDPVCSAGPAPAPRIACAGARPDPPPPRPAAAARGLAAADRRRPQLLRQRDRPPVPRHLPPRRARVRARHGGPRRRRLVRGAARRRASSRAR